MTNVDRMQHVFLALVGGLVIYEFVALSDQCEGDTISEIMWAATARRPLLPFAFGVMCGHFFWQREVYGGERRLGIDRRAGGLVDEEEAIEEARNPSQH